MVTFALRSLPLLVALAAWEMFVIAKPGMRFFFGRPSEILQGLARSALDGSLIVDSGVTGTEALLGFLLGTSLGTAAGVSFWFSRAAFDLAKPYIIVFSCLPVFALAPLLVIWFGTGFEAKVAVSTFSTFFIAITQSYNGITSVNPTHERLITALGGTPRHTFRKVALPTAIVWVVAGLKLSIGSALLGAFLGELITSEAGLGHRIMVASGLFDVNGVWVGLVAFVTLALVANFSVERLEGWLRKAAATL